MAPRAQRRCHEGRPGCGCHDPAHAGHKQGMEAMGERERFTALSAAHVTAVLGFVARRCDTPVDAADVTADVFVVAWRRIAVIPAGDGARLWLYGVARHALANQHRGETRRGRLGQALLDAWTGASAPDPAELFAVREQAVAARISRARRGIRRLLGESEKPALQVISQSSIALEAQS